jgi:ParB family chromosome partitioning protein
MLNFGARRLRASRLAGKETIPAFKDIAADSYAQVIENEQREGLRPLELAMFVKRELALGRSQSDIARLLGKSRTYITFVCAMIDPPDWLLEVYRSGKCRGVTELYELRRLHAADPVDVEHRVGQVKLVSRNEIDQLKTICRAASGADAGPATEHTLHESGSEPVIPSAQSLVKAPQPQRMSATSQSSLGRFIVTAAFRGERVAVLLNRSSAISAEVYVRRLSESAVFSARIDSLSNLALEPNHAPTAR